MAVTDELKRLVSLLEKGYDCHLSPPVARELATIVSDYQGNRDDLIASLSVIDHVRQVAHVDSGATPAEMIDHVRQVYAWAEFAQQLMEALARDGVGPNVRQVLERAPVDVRKKG